MTTAAAPRAGERHARLRVGRCEIVVPALAVVRALPLPAGGLTGLPRRRGALCGMLDFGGSAVPVVALDRWVALGEPGDAAAARLVVLRSGESLLAIRVDALVGIERLEPADFRTVCHSADAEELFDAVVPATPTRALLCILEVARLAALVAIWCDEGGVRSTAPRPAPQGRPATTRHALFIVGDRPWAVPALAITQLVEAPRAELCWPGQRVCGIGTWQRRKLPLVDLAVGGGPAGRRPGSATAGGSAAVEPRPWMAVMIAGPDAIGVVISRWERMLDLTEDEIAPAGGDPLLAGTALVAGVGTVSLLDVDALFLGVTEATISRVAAPEPGAAPRAALSSGRPAEADLDADHGAYLVFEADRRYASPVEGVLGVAPLPAAVVDDLARSGRATIDWRGQTLAVVAMPRLDGGRTAMTPRVAVIVRGPADGEACSAIAVGRLCDWLPVRTARRSGMRWHAVGQLTMITAPGGQRQGSLVVVDLAQMAYLLH